MNYVERTIFLLNPEDAIQLQISSALHFSKMTEEYCGYEVDRVRMIQRFIKKFLLLAKIGLANKKLPS